MDCLLLGMMLIACSLAVTDGQDQAIFERYQIRYNYVSLSGGDRFVQSVSANATSAADSALISGTDLWKVTLYASTNEDGSGETQVFPDVQLTPEQVSQTLQPGGTLMFDIPMNLNMDLLEGFTHLCLKTEKNPAANPDFVLTFKGTDELNLCMQINFDVPIVEFPEAPVLVPQPAENGQEEASFVRYETRYNYLSISGGDRFVQSVSANATSAADSALISGTDLWKVTLYASTNEDGSGETQVFPDVQLTPEQVSQTLQPGGTLMFDIPMNLNMDLLEGFTYLCLKTEKNPAANPDFVLTFKETDELNLCMQINFDVPIVEFPEAPVLVPQPAENGQEEASFVRYETRYNYLSLSGGDRFVQSVSANATSAADSALISGTDLWKVTLYASTNEDGSGETQVFPDVQLTPEQVSQTLQPGGTLMFDIPMNLNMDLLEGFTYLCLKTEKNPAANPDFVLTFKETDELNLCMPINFDVPIVEFPEAPVLVPQPAENGQEEASFVRYETRYNYLSISGGDRFVQSVSANATSAADSALISGTDLWKVTLYASTNEDGSGDTEVFPDVQLSPEQVSQTLQPGGTLMFDIPMNLNMDLLEGFTYLCLKTEKNPAANPDFVLTFKETDELNLCMPINFDVPIVEFPEAPVLVPQPENGQDEASFVRYETRYNYVSISGGDRFVQSVSANATSATDSALISGTDLWKVTLYASTNEDGSGETQVFPDVQLTPEQVSQTLQPGGTLMFDIPMNLNMDLLEDFTHLCLKTEKNPAANPDFVLTYDETDELNLCMPINFDVPIMEFPEAPVFVPEMRQRVDITKVNANMTFNQVAKTSSFVVTDLFYNLAFGSSSDVIQGENLWQMKFFVSKNEDGTGARKVISTTYQGYQASTIEPDTALTFQSTLSFDFLDDYGPDQLFEYGCVTFSEHPQTNADITFPEGESATVCQRLPSIEVEMIPGPPGPEEIVLEENRTCHLWGDPHQKTFDDYGYTHQGDYEYIAVTTCNGDDSVNDFEIVADNFRRIPSKPITYIRELRLYYNDVVYALTHPEEVSVDGVKVTLPYVDAENGVTIHYAAPHKILTTDCGLAIRLDNMHNSDITLPLRYMNKVCGLCGNFDGDRTNECHYRNGTTMGVHNEECKLDHAEEWKSYTPGEPEYPVDFRPALRPCDEGSPMLDMAMASCGILTDTEGPLAGCHEHADPEIYYNTCVYDLCQLLPEMFFLCSSVETYIYNCQRASNWETQVGDWRSVATACEPPCTGNMTFDPNGSPCPPSCADPDGTHTSCSIPHLEMCFCPEGTLLDGTKCIDPEECGCKMENGRYLSIGEEFVARDCSEYCTCEGRGNLQCHPLECVENSHCSVKAGVRNCYCDDGYMGNGREECATAGKVCHIYGDPHFHTYDEDFYSFQGDCTYVASKTCGDLPGNLTPFRLLIHNDALIPEERYTYLTMLRLHFKGKTFKMGYTGEISYDGQNIADVLPFNDGSISVQRDGDYIVAETSFGLKITYDRENDAEILLPPDYFGHVCGLCGNADGNSTNDKQMPDGTLGKKLDFANSWGVGDCPQLDKPVETCEVGTKDYERAVDICFLLQENPGPFSHCHDYKNPGKFVTSCIFDLCGTLPSTELFCSSAQSYLKACAEKGGKFDTDWKSKVKYCGTPTCAVRYGDFKQSCYKFIPTATDFASAEKICASEGSHLVTIGSRAENEYVAKLSGGIRSWLGAKQNRSASYSSYESAANNRYTFLPNRLVRGIGSIRFSVQTHSEAHLLLSSTKDVGDDTPVYEIVLGADRNKRNYLRRCKICEPKTEQTKSYLHKRRFRDFFVNFHEGNIQVGDMKNRELILEFKDPLPMRVRYVAFKSVGRRGSWKFYDNEFMWDTGEEWTYDNYRFGEPSNYQTEENCLEINFLHRGLWNDHFCTEQKAFVCENDGV